MNIPEYILRTFGIVCTTVLHGIAFLSHSLLGGRAQICYGYVRSWCRSVLWFSGVDVKVEGLDLLSPEQSYIFIVNHSSLFDIPVMQVALRRDVRIMYKKELEKVPFMGWSLKYSTFVPIVREKARDAMSTVQHTVDAITNDPSDLMVFAEGTRTSDGSLQKFKRGAFILAIKAGRPIVPVAISGTFHVLPKSTLRFRKGKVIVRIGKPMTIEAREYTRHEEIALMEQVHEQVAELLGV